MIADFGLSKPWADIGSNSAVLGMVAYIEPQCFIIDNYKRNEKSDIYSLGVLIWEISSGKPPFSEIPSFNINLKMMNLINNYNKIIIHKIVIKTNQDNQLSIPKIFLRYLFSLFLY